MNEIISDEILIEKCRQGDQTALNTIMNKYKPLVIKKARSLFLMGGETEDLIQEGMIGLFKAVQDYKDGKQVSFSNFARLCIERQIYTAVTTANRKKHSPLNGYISLSGSVNGEKDESLETTADMTLSPEEAVIDRERMRLIQNKLDEHLSSLESSVMRLYLDGYSYAQMAEKLGRKEKSIDNALRRIQAKLQAILQTMD